VRYEFIQMFEKVSNAYPDCFEMLAQKEAEAELLQREDTLNEAREQSLAEAAQAALNRSPR